MTNWVIIAAAGRSERIGRRNKMFIPLLGRPVLYYTIDVFEKCKSVDKIIIVAFRKEIQKYKNLVKKFEFKKVVSIIPGGDERQDSVFNGLKEIQRRGAINDDIIVIHNGANPLAREEDILSCIDMAKENDASVAAIPVKDTIKTVDENLFAMVTLDRKTLWAMQTPQVIKFGIAMRAFQKAFNDGFYGTDDVQLVERIRHRVKIVPCSYENFKITTSEDIVFAETVLEKRGVENAG